jgi:hypothetical protein
MIGSARDMPFCAIMDRVCGGIGERCRVLRTLSSWQAARASAKPAAIQTRFTMGTPGIVIAARPCAEPLPHPLGSLALLNLYRNGCKLRLGEERVNRGFHATRSPRDRADGLPEHDPIRSNRNMLPISLVLPKNLRRTGVRFLGFCPRACGRSPGI